jgi:hypothetical protein
MKKLLFLIIVACGVVSGCETKYYSVSITNKSTTKTVSYTYNGVSERLPVSETKFYEIKAYTEPPKKIVDQNGIASLKMNQNLDDFTFIDKTPFDLKVINELAIDITIKADNYIDNNGSMELTIDANKENTDAKIYTKSPIFTSATNYPDKIEFSYNIAEDVMWVIIR